MLSVRAPYMQIRLHIQKENSNDERLLPYTTIRKCIDLKPTALSFTHLSASLKTKYRIQTIAHHRTRTSLPLPLIKTWQKTLWKSTWLFKNAHENLCKTQSIRHFLLIENLSTYWIPLRPARLKAKEKQDKQRFAHQLHQAWSAAPLTPTSKNSNPINR